MDKTHNCGHQFALLCPGGGGVVSDDRPDYHGKDMVDMRVGLKS